jgi:hypothetical protein
VPLQKASEVDGHVLHEEKHEDMGSAIRIQANRELVWEVPNSDA